jgi:3-oxoacyl-[acyl-carrier protein] reductase
MPSQLDGQTAIITGSSSGIGKGAAVSFAEEGANVVTNSRVKDRAETTAEKIRAAGGEAIAVEADVSNRDDVQKLVDAAVKEYGHLDIMVNNAGISIVKPVIEMEPDEWHQVININLTGVFFGCQAAGKQMIEQGNGGQIINIASLFGKVGVQGRAPCNASKSGVINLTRCLAVEFGEHNIHVNALSPGFIKTQLDEVSRGEEDQQDFSTWPYYGYTDQHIKNRTTLDRFGSVDEMNNCLIFLASGDHYMTGENLNADGGYLAFGWGSKGT